MCKWEEITLDIPGRVLYEFHDYEPEAYVFSIGTANFTSNDTAFCPPNEFKLTLTSNTTPENATLQEAYDYYKLYDAGEEYDGFTLL